MACSISDDYRAPASRFNGAINWVRLEAGLDGHDHLLDPEHTGHPGRGIRCCTPAWWWPTASRGRTDGGRPGPVLARLAGNAIYRASYQRELVRKVGMERTAADRHGKPGGRRGPRHCRHHRRLTLRQRPPGRLQVDGVTLVPARRVPTYNSHCRRSLGPSGWPGWPTEPAAVRRRHLIARRNRNLPSSSVGRAHPW
jgi:hypothetical protein